MFISVEGLDGSGTTTVLEGLKEELDPVTTAEPSSLEYGQIVRENLSDDSTDPLVDFFLFMTDRRNHIEELIRPADENGNIVISDRYADSTRAYQPVALNGVVFDSEWDAKMFIQRVMDVWNYEPDLTLYIDISVRTALERADCDEKYETKEFLNRVKTNYEELVQNEDRMVRIDGEQSKEDVLADCLTEVERLK